ncbi:MAG: class I SAM-dependent methyltransferase [Proteobacteria bacterium]|nr:class I SAM-dependent methyltransferase [Pseudomonadota bacterium]
MTNIKTATSFFFWFLKRPSLYREFVRLSAHKLSTTFSPSKDTRKESEAWCEKQALNSSEAIKQITGKAVEVPIREKFSEIFKTAEVVANNCSEKMGGAGELDLLYAMTEFSQAKKVIETGVAYGWSSLSMLLSLSTRENSKLISTDMPYPGRNNDNFVGCVVPDSLRKLWKLIRLADRDGLPLALQEHGSIDLCHYDSDKRYNSRMWAYPLLWNALTKNGIFMSDDIGDNIAFKDFCDYLKMKPTIVRTPSSHGFKYIGILVKPSSGN